MGFSWCYLCWSSLFLFRGAASSGAYPFYWDIGLIRDQVSQLVCASAAQSQGETKHSPGLELVGGFSQGAESTGTDLARGESSSILRGGFHLLSAGAASCAMF